MAYTKFNMYGIQILDFIGGFIEFVFVPPFISDWQELMATRTVVQSRRRVQSKLVADLMSIDKSIRVATYQQDQLLQTMVAQDNAIRETPSGPAGMEQLKTIAAMYKVNRQTVQKLRDIVYMMCRVRSQLTIRLAILNTAKDALALKSSPDYVLDVTEAVGILTDSESETENLMELLNLDNPDPDRWSKAVSEFLQEMDRYDMPPPPTDGECTVPSAPEKPDY